MRYTIIIPNLNGRHLLEVCLPALVQQTENPADIIVVDNGSTDGSCDYLRDIWPRIRVIPLETNTGFTGANNAGAAAGDSDLVVLLNNDTLPSAGWLQNLLSSFSDPSVGAVSSSMRRMGEPETMDSAGGSMDTLGYTFDRGRGEPASGWTDSGEVLFPCGGAMALRRDALEEPDRIFWDILFCYNEDADLGFRLWKSGYRCVYNPAAVVEHRQSATAGLMSPFLVRYCIRNRLLVLRRHLGEHFARIRAPLARWETLALGYMLAKGEITRFRASLRGCRAGFAIDVEPWGNSEEGLRLCARFMHPTAGSAVRRRLGAAVYERISRPVA